MLRPGNIRRDHPLLESPSMSSASLDRELLAQIRELERPNHTGLGQIYILQDSLRLLLTAEVIERALEVHHEHPHKKRRRTYTTDFREKTTRLPNSLYVHQNLQIVFAILSLQGGYEAIQWFVDNRYTDDNLPFSREKLAQNRLLVDINGLDTFLTDQMKFPPKIKPDMRRTMPDDIILPFQALETAADRQGTHGEVFRVTIHPEYDGIHDSGKKGAAPGNVSPYQHAFLLTFCPPGC